MKKNKIIIIVAALIILVSAYSAFTKKDDTSSVYYGEAVGETYQITTKTPGLLEEVFFGVGDHIEVGDLVAKIENTDVDFQIQLAKNNVEIARANLDKGTSPIRSEDMKILENKLLSIRANIDILKNSRSSLLLALEENKLNLSNSLDILNDLKKDYDNSKVLFDSGSISKNALDKSLLAYNNHEKKYKALELNSLKLKDELASIDSRIEILNLEINSTEENIEVAKTGLDNYDRSIAQLNLKNAITSEKRLLEQGQNRNVYSKQGGIIENINYSLGEYISPGMPIITLYDTDKLKMTIYIHEKDLALVNLGDEIRVSLSSDPSLDAKGLITYVANEAMFTPFNIVSIEDRERLVYEVEISLENKDYIHPGMLLEIDLKSGDNNE